MTGGGAISGRAIESRTTESRTIESRAIESRTFESRTFESRTFESRTIESSWTEGLKFVSLRVCPAGSRPHFISRAFPRVKRLVRCIVRPGVLRIIGQRVFHIMSLARGRGRRGEYLAGGRGVQGNLFRQCCVPMRGPGDLAFQRHTRFREFSLQFFGGLLQVVEPLAVLADYVFEVRGHCLTSSVRPYRAIPGAAGRPGIAHQVSDRAVAKSDDQTRPLIAARDGGGPSTAPWQPLPGRAEAWRPLEHMCDADVKP